MTNTEKACRAIRAARHESQVIAAVRDYLDALDVTDAASLPAGLLAVGLVPAEEMIQSALQSLHAVIAEKGAKGSAILSETSLVLTTAARRLATLAKDTA